MKLYLLHSKKLKEVTIEKADVWFQWQERHSPKRLLCTYSFIPSLSFPFSPVQKHLMLIIRHISNCDKKLEKSESVL